MQTKDDFGTGYCSLSYLHRFPTHMLKIDAPFVRRLGAASENSELVRLIITVAHTLGRQVVAAGVETAAQAAQLREMKCDYGQGYFFSRPVLAGEAEKLIASR